MSFLGKLLGTDLTPGAAASSSPLAVILALAATRPVFVADYYVVDGVSGKVRSWIDQNDPTHVLDQSNTARQVALPAAHADFANQLCATFNDTGLYISNRAASAFLYCQDGSGVSGYVSCTPTEAPATANRFIFGTHGVPAGPFVLLLAVNGASTYQLEINDGTTGIYAQTAAISSGTPTYFSYHFATSRNPDLLFKQRGATANESDLTGPPSGSAPKGPLLLGANSSFGNLGRFRWRHLMFFPLLDASGQATVESYLLSDSGLAA